MLSEAGLRRALASAGLDAPVRWDDVTTSTNDVARELAAGGAPAWTLVGAGHQTAGRGRAGRTWVDQPGGAVMLSLVLRPSLPPARLGLVSLATGVAMADAATELSGLGVRCTWPNDLQVDGAKVGGILAESEVEGEAVRYVVVGIGVNLAAPADVPGAGALGDLDAEALVAAFLHRLASLLDDTDEIVDAWRAVSGTLGRNVEATTHDGTVVRGVARDVDETGALLVDAHRRGIVRVAFGDVRILLPVEAGPTLQEALRGGGMFARFTADAKRVIARADLLSADLGHPVIEPGHLLVALAEEGPNAATRALADAGFDAVRAREDLVRSVETSGSRSSATAVGGGELHRGATGRLQAPTKKVFEYSLRNALRLGDDWIGAEHLLLAALERGGPDIASILAAQELSPETIRVAVEREVPPPPRLRRLRGRGGSR